VSTKEILGVGVAVTTYEEIIAKCVEWAMARESRAVVFANVHVLMEAHDDLSLFAQLNSADVVNPDGMPLVWALRAMGEWCASRVYGPDATEALLREAEVAHIPVGFYGGSESTLSMLMTVLRQRYPQLEIAFSMSPPFRALTVSEDEHVVREVAASGVRLLFIGLGCPKQERWIMEHRGRIPSVMLGVGAAFDFIAGSKPQAPRWMMRSGLEWLFRFASEPRRLGSRYLKTNPRFVGLFLRDLLKGA
jgi:N-acetylglucosaminyldiphosphoundecaprenol N-acetyl-beta-D-mannosaminyltransferase